MKKVLCLVLVAVVISSIFGISSIAEEPQPAVELTAMIDGLLGNIRYDSSWFDVNADDCFNILDIIREKQYLAGVEVDYSPVKYVDVYYHDYKTDEVYFIDRQYTNEIIFPALPSGKNYWMIGKTGYRQGETYYFAKHKSERHIYAVKEVKEYIV